MRRLSSLICTVMAGVLVMMPVTASATPKWVIKTTPNPTGAQKSELFGVSCSGTNLCIAVGAYNNSENVRVTLAERWNGTEWKLQSTPNPSESKGSELLGVSCTGTKEAAECVAVGSYINSSSGAKVSFAEFFNTASWEVVTTPTPPGAKSSELAGVSCTTNGSGGCFAVGSYINKASVRVTLAEFSNSVNKETWKIQTTPNPSESTQSELLGVSCINGESCYAVGAYNKAGRLALAEHWNNKEWVEQKAENIGTNDIFLGVTCPSGCTAVGAYSSSGKQVTLAEGGWIVQKTPNPAGALASVLHGVSCLSSHCMAVGDYVNSEKVNVVLVENYNGSEWVIQEAPNPEVAGFAALWAVSCPETIVCTAVGYYDVSTFFTLAEQYK
jgi:hypothetical protein